MAKTAKGNTNYENLRAFSEQMIGEIGNGELIAYQRSSAAHTFTASLMGANGSPLIVLGRVGGPLNGS